MKNFFNRFRPNTVLKIFSRKTSKNQLWISLIALVFGISLNVAAQVTNVNTAQTFSSIQAAIDDANTLNGHVISVAPGTYNENVSVYKSLTIESSAGRASTIVNGSASGALGTFTVQASSVTIGGAGKGFTITGYDNSNPGIEYAAVYIQGVQSNAMILDNEIIANGEAGLLTEFGQAVNGLVVDGNKFSGTTFTGATAGDCGFANQFTATNVPRQLVNIPTGSGITFTNNIIAGTAGSASAASGCTTFGQGNTIVTIDASNVNISRNTFAGTTTRFGSHLRARGVNASISCNIFDNTGLGLAATHIAFNGSLTALSGGANPSTIAGIATANSFINGGAYFTGATQIFRDSAQVAAAALTPILAVTSASTPTITCPADISQSNDSGVCGASVVYTITATDDCSTPTMVQIAGLSSGSLFPIGTTTNTFVATNASGSKDTCSFTVTITDDENPTITCPTNITANTATGTCGAVVTFSSPTFGDNCPGSTMTQTAGMASGSTFPKGMTTNTFKVTDAAGNTNTCSFTVTVSDNEFPAISCPSNISANATSAAGRVVNFTAPVGTDNCPGATTTQTAGLASGSTFPIGTTTNTFSVTDASGNTTTCSFTVTISGIKPDINCPGNITLNNATGTCGNTATFSATDTTGVPASTITYSINSGSLFPIGTTTVTAIATNAVGADTCTFTVTVNFSTTTAVSYTLLASKEIHLQYNTVYGNVGVWTANKKAKITKETDVYGFVKAPIIELLDISTISGAQITAQAPTPPNNFRYNTLPDTASSITVPDNYSGVYNLSGNVFKKIEVGKNSILNFTSSGDIYVQEFKTKDADNSNFTQVRFSGATNLIIKKKMELGSRTKFNQTGSNMVNVFVEENSVKIKLGSMVTANIDVRFDKLDVGGTSASRTVMNGYYIADNIFAKEYITWNGACQAQGPAARSVHGSPGIASVSNPFDVSVYPNPTKGDFNIIVNSTSDAPVRATVYDIMGRILVDNNNLKANVNIPVSKTLSNGMYLIRIDQNGVSQTMHLVKE
jgi:hypothetical protein